ncbi:hypothetical protein GCM10009599_05870 [Luteococcus peritonei]
MPTVAAPIITTVTTMAGLRPKRSPRWEITKPPSGRTTKPTAKVAKANSCWVAGSDLGKKSGPITSAEAMP